MWSIKIGQSLKFESTIELRQLPSLKQDYRVVFASDLSMAECDWTTADISSDVSRSPVLSFWLRPVPPHRSTSRTNLAGWRLWRWFPSFLSSRLDDHGRSRHLTSAWRLATLCHCCRRALAVISSTRAGIDLLRSPWLEVRDKSSTPVERPTSNLNVFWRAMLDCQRPASTLDRLSWQSAAFCRTSLESSCRTQGRSSPGRRYRTRKTPPRVGPHQSRSSDSCAIQLPSDNRQSSTRCCCKTERLR